MSVTPARVFKLPGGSLKAGNVADITVFSPHLPWVVDPTDFRSKGRNSPFAGQQLTGRATCTIVGGRIVHNVGVR
jgi:dihydroorotase